CGTCCPPARISAPPISPMAATACIRWSGTLAKWPGCWPGTVSITGSHRTRCRKTTPGSPTSRHVSMARGSRSAGRTCVGIEAHQRRNQAMKLSHLRTTAALAGVLLPLAWSGVAWAQDAVNLRMALWSANEAHLALFNEIAEGFTATHPNVTVTFEPIPFDKIGRAHV